MNTAEEERQSVRINDYYYAVYFRLIDDAAPLPPL